MKYKYKKTKLIPKTQLVELIKVGELEKGTIAQVPEIAFNDGKARPLEFSSEIYAKTFQKHGPFSHENLIATANQWDYLIKDLNEVEGHINLIKELPDGSALLIGFDAFDKAFFINISEELVMNLLISVSMPLIRHFL